MSAESGSVTRHADHFFVPIAQNTERACPKRQVAGESPAGDTISRVWFNSRMRPCQGRDGGAIPFTRSNHEVIAPQACAARESLPHPREPEPRHDRAAARRNNGGKIRGLPQWRPAIAPLV